MKDLVWNVFKKTGSITSYLLLKLRTYKSGYVP